MAGDGRGGLSGELWLQIVGSLFDARRLDRKGAEGGAAGRDAGPAADPARVGDQPESGACYRHRDPRSDPRPRRRGHRVTRRDFMALLATTRPPSGHATAPLSLAPLLASL